MKTKILAVVLTTCVLFLNMFPPVVSASETELVVDSSETELVVDSSETELVPMVAAYCPGSSTNTSGSFQGYRYSYSSNAYIKYRLQHPDGKTIDIMSETNQSVALARDYMFKIEEMKNAEENAEAISDILGFALNIVRMMVTRGITAEVFKNMTQKTIADHITQFIFSQSLNSVAKEIIEDIIEAVMPDFCNIQELMKDADNIYDDLWYMVNNS